MMPFAIWPQGQHIFSQMSQPSKHNKLWNPPHFRNPTAWDGRGRQGKRGPVQVKKYDETESLVIACRSGTGKYQKMVGALYCVFNDGTLCEVGSGLSDVQRVVKEAELTIVAKVITVRHHGLTDAGIPRFPTFVCVRNDRDPWEVMNSVKRLA
eukprot:Sspe_Gene.106341::Locus_83933_Transcript_1_1_Confidence_1.000_Length_487::g.106341::m.106341/K10747/LIG1; DNA ligase 1